MFKTYLTAESVCAGHPDKLCDFIADSILDACMKEDKNSRVACEVLATKGLIVVAGEITSSASVDISSIVKNAIFERGYKVNDYKVEVHVHTQSTDISDGVDVALEVREGQEADRTLGAGDQGIVYGFATNETEEFLPLPIVLAHDICRKVDEARNNSKIAGLGPDGKAQVTVEYNGAFPIRVKTIVVSVQHEETKDCKILESEILNEVLKPVFMKFPFDDDTEILINPSGRFVEGGPAADTGLTGRKIMVDTYGGLASHGGGAFSGKDPTKVDRSGAYFARYIAKNIVASGIASKCEVAISYAIGKADPVSVSINTFNTSEIENESLSRTVKDGFNARPKAIIELFNLLEVEYSKTSAYGHFGNSSFPWEKTDRVSDLKKEIRNR